MKDPTIITYNDEYSPIIKAAFMNGVDPAFASRVPTIPQSVFLQGMKGSGKSSVLEGWGEYYVDMVDACWCDIFGSRDAEACALGRSDIIKGKKVLFIRDESVDIKCAWAESRTAVEITLQDFLDYDFIISSSPFYGSLSSEMYSAGVILDRMYQDFQAKRTKALVLREGSNLLYSRSKLVESQSQAKSQAVYLARESRHLRIAWLIDQIRAAGTEKEIRTTMDCKIFKAQGGMKVEETWIFRYFSPHAINRLAPQNGVLLTKGGYLAYCQFRQPGVTISGKGKPWHKKDTEFDILAQVGISCEYSGEVPEQGKDKGTFSTIGDLEHSNIINLYIDEHLGMKALSNRLQPHRSTATISAQVLDHDDAINRGGCCMRCERVHGAHSHDRAKRVEQPIMA